MRRKYTRWSDMPDDAIRQAARGAGSIFEVARRVGMPITTSEDGGRHLANAYVKRIRKALGEAAYLKVRQERKVSHKWSAGRQLRGVTNNDRPCCKSCGIRLDAAGFCAPCLLNAELLLKHGFWEANKERGGWYRAWEPAVREVMRRATTKQQRSVLGISGRGGRVAPDTLCAAARGQPSGSAPVPPDLVDGLPVPSPSDGGTLGMDAGSRDACATS